MRWFRFYHEALDDPKVQRLCPELFKAWVNILCLASEGTPRGSLPSVEDIAFRLRLDLETTTAHCLALEGAGLVEWVDGFFQPHNWKGRQPPSDDVTPRVTKHRKEKEQPVTFHETLQKRESNALDKKRVDREEIREEEKLTSFATANAAKAKRATSLPDDFMVDDEMTNWALAKGFSFPEIEEQTERFQNHAVATGRRQVDWKRSWMNWLTSPLNKSRGSPNGTSKPHNKAQEQEDMLIRIAREGYR